MRRRRRRTTRENLKAARRELVRIAGKHVWWERIWLTGCCMSQQKMRDIWDHTMEMHLYSTRGVVVKAAKCKVPRSLRRYFPNGYR